MFCYKELIKKELVILNYRNDICNVVIIVYVDYGKIILVDELLK